MIVGHSINHELYRIHKIDGALAKKIYRMNKEVKSIFEA